jgi:hypothetical protein
MTDAGIEFLPVGVAIPLSRRRIVWRASGPMLAAMASTALANCPLRLTDSNLDPAGHHHRC